MVLITTKICNICKSNKCDGQEYITEDMWGSYGHYIGNKKVCKNTEGVFFSKENNHLMYNLVCGHGDETRYFVFPISITKTNMDKCVKKLHTLQKKKMKKRREKQTKTMFKNRRYEKYLELKKEFEGGN